MTNKECSICGRVESNKMSHVFELENGKLLCIKCYEKMSGSEKEDINSILKSENGKISQNNLDVLLSVANAEFGEEFQKALNSPEWKETAAKIRKDLGL